MTLRDKLLNIKKELYLDKDPKEIIKEGIDIKIGRTEDNYNETVKKNCMYILSRSNYKVMMAIDRYNRRKDRINKNEENDKYGFVETI